MDPGEAVEKTEFGKKVIQVTSFVWCDSGMDHKQALRLVADGDQMLTEGNARIGDSAPSSRNWNG